VAIEKQIIIMKQILILIVAFVVGVFYSCGPAAEDRTRMDYVAKRTSDSIARFVDSSLNDPLKENVFKQAQPAAPAPVTTTTAPQGGK
jgi:hypothetical protein